MDDSNEDLRDATNADLPPRWAMLLDRLAADHPLVRRTKDWICLGWPAQEQAPPQTVQVKCLVVQEKMRILVTADICRAELVPAQDALEAASHLLLGAIILQKGIVAIRHIFTDGHFALEDVAGAIFQVRDEAVRVRAQFAEQHRQRTTNYFSSHD